MRMYEITKLAPTQIEDQPVVTIQQSYAKRVDFINDNLLYKGEALILSSPASAVWRIKRITITNEGDVTEEFASSTFDQIWNDRLTLGYS